jgi:arylsulfatase A-like enzyme
MDLLPTFAAMAGAALPRLPIDGHDVRGILFGEASAKSPWDAKGLMFYRIDQLQAVRSGPWKLYLPLAEKIVANNGKTAAGKMELYNLVGDVGEEREVAAENPAVVRRLTAMAEHARVELGDFRQPGWGQRRAGYVAKPRALVK